MPKRIFDSKPTRRRSTSANKVHPKLSRPSSSNQNSASYFNRLSKGATKRQAGSKKSTTALRTPSGQRSGSAFASSTITNGVVTRGVGPVIAQSATNPNLPEDRPRQLPGGSPSAKATQKFFFKKQVQSLEQNTSNVSRRKKSAAMTAQVDTLSK